MFERQAARTLRQRLGEPRRFMQVVVGPRQTGKTTAVKQAVKSSGLPAHVASADGLSIRGAEWIELQWSQARLLCAQSGKSVLVLDEIQKAENWSETVKRLWDEDTWNDVNLLVVLSGSSTLLLNDGLTESLMGRHEVIRSTHWLYPEMREAFGYSVDDYLLWGGYPGSAPIKDDPDRWMTYMRDSIVESTISRDVLQLQAIRKPSLMRRLFELGMRYSGQEISYRNLLGQLDDKGNTDTIAHYLELLDGAGMLCGLKKYDRKALSRAKSSPRLLAYDTSLMVACSEEPPSYWEEPSAKGHLVETAVGATLLARSASEGFKVHWWREGNDEVDFVVSKGSKVTAIEVKSGLVGSLHGLAAFKRAYPEAATLVVGGPNLSLQDFLDGKVALFA